jgi:outer membrane protein assembly factor BamE (lipoprotein component of BamABCDE complex)
VAIAEKKPIEGMDRDQVLLAMGRPLRKSRESKDGVDYEDWIYGQPPGRVTFVTFSGPKVVKIKETYAGLGGTIAETPKQP